MNEYNIIGREYEQKLMQGYIDSNKAELIAVYGRRRVGKTYLVKSIFNNKFDFAFTGLFEVTRAVHLAQFKKYLEKYSGQKVKRPKDWFEAFDALRNYLDMLKKDKIIVFLDEIPWMDTPKSNFLAAFSQFWNDWASTKKNLKLFVCGSATTWMLSKFIGDKGGIYGRVCRPIWLAPFSLAETEQFLKEVKGIEVNRHQLIKAYMVLGGIPYYLDMLAKDISLDLCIDDLFFRQGAPLRTEFDFLFRSLFKESKIYKNVVTILAAKLKGLTRQEILDELKLQEGGMLTEVLDNLIKCDFVRKYTAIGKTERDAIYQLTDLFSLFHIKYVENHNGQDEHLWSKFTGTGQVTSWSGYAFEQVCLHHIPQIKVALGINGIIKCLGAVRLIPDVKVEAVAALCFRAVGTCQIVVFLPQVCHFCFRSLDLCFRFLFLGDGFLCLFLELFLLALLLLDDEVVPFQMVNSCFRLLLSSLHVQCLSYQILDCRHVLSIQLEGLACVVVHPVPDDMSMVVRLP